MVWVGDSYLRASLPRLSAAVQPLYESYSAFLLSDKVLLPQLAQTVPFSGQLSGSVLIDPAEAEEIEEVDYTWNNSSFS